jgi:hypothetical protein
MDGSLPHTPADSTRSSASSSPITGIGISRSSVVSMPTFTAARATSVMELLGIDSGG